MPANEFRPTHTIEITTRGSTRHIPVQLVDGSAYTADEWETETAADWEVVEGAWLFQGGVPTCESYRVVAKG